MGVGLLAGGACCSSAWQIGDGVAPRQAPYAIYEGRKVGLEI